MKRMINQWYNVSVYLAGAAALVAILVPMDITARLLWASISILFLHFFEEFGAPSGFPFMGMKVLMGSSETDKTKWNCNNLSSVFGIQMYQRFHNKGKQTIYGPGSITAYFGFGVFGVILCYQIIGRTITVTDWIVAALVVFVGVGIICVLGPETIIKKRDNDYAFPSADYFERFLK